jgi:hypothetical protein
MSADISNSTVPAGSTEQWRDKKRYLWLIGLVVPSLAFVAVGMHQLTGWGVWWWLGPIVILVVVPAIDLLVESVSEAGKQDRDHHRSRGDDPQRPQCRQQQRCGHWHGFGNDLSRARQAALSRIRPLSAQPE